MLYPRTKVIIATFIGTVFQWLEFGSYSALIPIIAALFYPVGAPFAHTLGTSVSLFFTYALLPLGAIAFGMIGDKYGRKKALSAAIFLMGTTSLLLGYLPTYSDIGLTATFLLLFFRFAQGMALAGAIAGASLFLVEQRRNYWPNVTACWMPIATGIGLLSAFVLTQSLTHELLMSWAWRIPFFFSAVSCIIAAYLHFSSKETPAFTRMMNRQQHVKIPLLELLRNHKMSFLKVLCITTFTVIYIEICTLYYYYVLLAFLHLSHPAALSLLLFEVLLFLALLPIIAFVADKVGSRSILLMGLLGCSLSAPLLFVSAPSQSLFILFFVEGFFAFFSASALAPLFRFQINLFPVPIRYTGLSLAWVLSISLFGGSTLHLAEHIMHRTHWLALPAAIASASALLTFILIFVIYPSRYHKIKIHARFHSNPAVLKSHPF